MRGKASAKSMQLKSRSLMQRLALATGAEASGTGNDRVNYRPTFGAYFGLGLLGGGIVGAAMLLGLQVFSGHFNPLDPLRAQVPSAIAALAHWAPQPSAQRFGKTTGAVVPEARPDAFDVVVERSARANAPFGLRLVGTEDKGIEVLLRDVPPGAVLSRGERRGLSTWAVRADELANLRLTINDGTPDTFDVRIQVLAPASMAAAESIARIRLVGQPVVVRTASAPVVLAPQPVVPAVVDTAVAGEEATLPPMQAVARSEPVRDVPKAKVTRAPPPSTPAAAIDRRAAPPAETRHWPEGASGLGAVARESDRQMWWKLPVPTWSPFFDLTAGR